MQETARRSRAQRSSPVVIDLRLYLQSEYISRVDIEGLSSVCTMYRMDGQFCVEFGSVDTLFINKL